MSVIAVQRTIEQVQRHISEFQSNPPNGPVNLYAPANNSELSTRYIIIDPILRALGWDLSDPNQCTVEYRLGWGKPDYVLCDSLREPVVVVEAKRIEEDTRFIEHQEKTAGYADSIPTARAAVLTNGQYWFIGYVDNNGDVQLEGKGRPLGLHWQDSYETAQRLCEHLQRSIYW